MEKKLKKHLTKLIQKPDTNKLLLKPLRYRIKTLRKTFGKSVNCRVTDVLISKFLLYEVTSSIYSFPCRHQTSNFIQRKVDKLQTFYVDRMVDGEVFPAIKTTKALKIKL